MAKCFALFLLPLLAAAQAAANAEDGLKLVSQTFNGVGELTIKTQPPQPPVQPSKIKMSMMLDVEAVRYRMDQNVFMNYSQYNMTGNTIVSVIFEASSKRFTMFHEEEMTGPAPKSTKNCSSGSFPTLHEPAVVAKCLQDALANFKPSGSDDGLEKYVMHLPATGPGSSPGSEAFYFDKDNVMKKTTLDLTVANMTEHMELVDPDAKAGTPDASVFVPPADWGKCAESPVPPPPTGKMPVSLQAFIKCVGLINEQVTEVLV